MICISRWFAVTTVCACFSAAASGLAPEVAQRHAREIDELLTRAHGFELFNGAILVAEEGEIVYRKGFGPANRSWEIPIAPDTRFRVGSITKGFTAVLAMQLVEDGTLDLDAHVSDYLPDYPKANGERITVRHLLTHRSGLPNYPPDIAEFRSEKSGVWTASHKSGELIPLFWDMDLKFEPGTKFEYCNSGYYLMGVIIEKVTGKPFAEALRERILGPAGLVDTTYPSVGAVLSRMSTGYYQDMSGYREARYVSPTVFFSAGAMVSTVDDLFRWDQALHGDTLVSEESKTLLFSPQYKSETGGYGYGFGIRRVPLEGQEEPVEVVAHAGDNPGFFGVVLRDLETNDFIAFLTNTNALSISNMTDILVPILSILHDRPYSLPRQSGARALIAVIEEEGIEVAKAKYRTWLAHEADSYDLSETQLNRLGYNLLQRGLNREAVEVFELNTETYPDSFNTWDSLGEAYLAIGDKGAAISSYRRSLELNPDNQNAVKMLKGLEK